MFRLAFLLCFAFVMIANTNILLSSQTMVMGKLTDDQTGKILIANIQFKSAQGSKVRTKSNPVDGSFSVLLTGGQDYTVIISGNDVLRNEFKITPKAEGGYNEEKMDFQATQLLPGRKVLELDLFTGSSAKLSPKGKDLLKSFKKTMRFNRYVSFKLEVGADSKILSQRRVDTINIFTTKWKKFLKRLEVANGGTNPKATSVIVTKIENSLK